MTCGNTVGPAAGIQQNADNGFVRRVDFEPGYDCLEHHGDAIGRKCHGRHGMNMRFVLMGEEGAVQFLLYASDFLPGSTEHGHTKRDKALMGVMAADLGHHWIRPTYEGESNNGACEYLHGAECFYDGSGLNAEDILVRFLSDGLDAVWEDLEDYYRRCARHAAATARGEDPYDESTSERDS